MSEEPFSDYNIQFVSGTLFIRHRRHYMKVGALVDFVNALMVEVLVTTLVDVTDVLGVVRTDVTTYNWIRRTRHVEHHDKVNDLNRR